MRRREFLGLTAAAGLGLLAGGGCATGRHENPTTQFSSAGADTTLKLLPYPQQIVMGNDSLALGIAKYELSGEKSKTMTTAMASLDRHLPKSPRNMRVQLGSIEEGFTASWLTAEEHVFLADAKTSAEASIVKIEPRGITVVGKGKWGMLYGVQTINQLIIQATRENRSAIPCATIRDWPDLRWRCLAPTLAWYSGWNRLEGYDICNWSEGEWKWLADWSMLHKCNAWAVCMYGYWPFSLPGYEKEELSVDSDWFNPATEKKEKHHFTHRNIAHEFYPEVIRYANERGIKVHAYIGKNSFNGRAFGNNAALSAGGAAEMLPFAPGVEEYWDAFIGRILEIGFNGFVFEDPEANHVPNQNEQCWKTFWEPWAKKYGYKSVKETDQNNPPLGVHIEYYCWLFRSFDELIQKHAAKQGKSPEIYLISHVLLARIVNESKTKEERDQWLAMVDEKHGRKVPFIITESNEKAYVDMFGGDRIASLGGRGGSCTNAMRRIASVNNDWCAGGMGGDLAYERECQKHIVQAGGFGAMGYIFEWTNTEVFAYLAAQHLWRNAGIPGVSNTDQTGILYYAYQLYYGDAVGTLVTDAMDGGSCVNDAMVLENIHGSQWPFTGKVLHRDYQLLAVLADEAQVKAREAYKLFTGNEPELYKASYDQDAFKWDGYSPAQDKVFKTERLRLLWVGCRRSQEMCEAALAHRLAQRLIVENAPREKVLNQFDSAIGHATLNQRIYQLNYEDDYDATDGLCAAVTEEINKQRKDYALSPKPAAVPPVLFLPWEKQSDIIPRQSVSCGHLNLRAGVGFSPGDDLQRTGVVFTVQIQDERNNWQTVYRKIVHRRQNGFADCEIPLPARHELSIRFIADSYSRAMYRNQPKWTWAVWRGLKLVRDGRVVYDFADRISEAQAFVQLDADGKQRPFDHAHEDSTGATFVRMKEDAAAIEAFTPHKDGKFGVTVAEYRVKLEQ